MAYNQRGAMWIGPWVFSEIDEILHLSPGEFRCVGSGIEGMFFGCVLLEGGFCIRIKVEDGDVVILPFSGQNVEFYVEGFEPPR